MITIKKITEGRSLSKVLVLLVLLQCFIFTATVWATPEDARAAAGQKSMSTSQAVVLGVVEGLTEFLPVSSTGHLLMAEQIMSIGDAPSQSPTQLEKTKEAADAYTICIQIGAILAVLWLYFGRIKQIFRGMMGKDLQGRALLINAAVAFLPAAVLGLLFNSLIKSYLFGPWPVIFAWLIGGLAILLVSRRNQARSRVHGHWRLLDDITWKMALVIGFAQCIAMWPGVSRSLVTIVGGLLVGLTMNAAVEFSFLLGMVTLSAATAYDILKHGSLMLHTFDHMSLIIGVVVAFIAAVISVKWMVNYLSHHGLEIFGYYRVFIAVAASLYLMTTVTGIDAGTVVL